MKRRITALALLTLRSAVYFTVATANSGCHPQPHTWQTLALASDNERGRFVVRQKYRNAVEGWDTAFGYCAPLGKNYLYFLSTESDRWRSAHITVADHNVVTIIRNNNEKIATFYPSNCLMVLHRLGAAFGKGSGLENARGSSFFSDNAFP